MLTSIDKLPTSPDPSTGSPKWREAPYYSPSADLVTTIEVAMALRLPLLLTGDPGCGKTAAAYWVGWRLGLQPEDLIHVQVRSDSTAARLKYEFDAVKYFRESQANASKEAAAALAAAVGRDASRASLAPGFDEDRRRFITHGLLWTAFERSRVRPTILLLDEIDKAPRDLPNDLLLEFDAMRFEVPDLDAGGQPAIVEAGEHLKLVVFTSNGERQLPDAFLRRCVHHHLRFDEKWASKVVQHRIEKGDIRLAKGLVEHAIVRFVALKGLPLRHRPGLAELLVWMRVMALAGDIDPEKLERVKLQDLPYLGALLKDPSDLETLAGGR